MKVASKIWQRSWRTSPAASSYIQPCTVLSLISTGWAEPGYFQIIKVSLAWQNVWFLFIQIHAACSIYTQSVWNRQKVIFFSYQQLLLSQRVYFYCAYVCRMTGSPLLSSVAYGTSTSSLYTYKKCIYLLWLKIFMLSDSCKIFLTVPSYNCTKVWTGFRWLIL